MQGRDADHGGRGAGAQVGLGHSGWVEQDYLVLVLKGVGSKAPVVLVVVAGPGRKTMACVPGAFGTGNRDVAAVEGGQAKESGNCLD